MKKLFKVLVAVFALGLVILAGLHLFLQYGLTKTMREVVLPRVKAETGIDARVGRLSLNIAAGSLRLEEVALRNPDGFLLENLASIERINVEVDIASLLNQEPITVKTVEVKNALLNVIRNKDGEINLQKLQQALPPSEAAPPEKTAPAEVPVEAAPVPELLIESLLCDATLRYIDFKVEQFDVALDLDVAGSGVSTVPEAEWGEVAVVGALGTQRTSFVTDLKLRLAPLTDPAAPSFDLTGKIMEIDPRILEKVYDKAGIRSKPFGLEPALCCRDGAFQDSAVALEIPYITFEEKLAKKLGGVSTIGSLRFSVPVEGPLNRPRADVQGELLGALGGNVVSVIGSVVKGVVEPPAKLVDSAVDALGEKVEEIGESETIKKVLKGLAGGEASATNAPSPDATDVLVDLLGEHVDEVGENDELKKELKNLGKFLFGK